MVEAKIWTLGLKVLFTGNLNLQESEDVMRICLGGRRCLRGGMAWKGRKASRRLATNQQKRRAATTCLLHEYAAAGIGLRGQCLRAGKLDQNATMRTVNRTSCYNGRPRESKGIDSA